jgi:hypothetical protein
VNPGFVIDRAGSYTVELIVHDGTAPSLPDLVAITTENTAPVANAGADQTATVTATVTLDGGASSDVDGDPLTFRWSFLSRPPGSASALSDPAAVMPTFVTDEPGTYSLQLIVNDGTLESVPDTVAVTTANSPPVADAGADQSALVGDTVTLDGSGSNDVDGDPLTSVWSLTIVPPGSAANLSDPSSVTPSFTVDLPGTYVAQLIVNDGTASSQPDTVSISTSNSPPVAAAGDDQLVVAGDLVALDGTASSDADGDPLLFRWSITTRPQASTAVLVGDATDRPAFVADEAGDYVVQLIVNDGTVDSAPDTVLIGAASQPAAVVVIEATDASAAESADGGQFTITRTGDPVSPLSVTYLIIGTATNGADYQPISTNVTIEAGSSTATIDITPIDDDLIEPTERVELRIVDGAGYAAGSPSLAIVSIADDDLPVVTVTAGDANASEAGPAEGTFTFSRTGGTGTDLPVLISRGGTAISSNTGPQDYAAIGEAITIPAGASQATVTLVPLTDNLLEGTETVVLTIRPAPGYVVGAPAAATVTISDDPPVVNIQATDADASESGGDRGVFLLSRSGGDSGAELVVDLEIGGTAVNNTDYALISGLATIPVGETSLPITVVPIPDSRVETPESVVITIQPRSGEPTYQIGTPDSATVTIADDPAIVTVVATDPDASEAGPDPAVLTFTRSGGNLSAPLLVFVSRGGTAANGSDYPSLGGSTFIVTIPADTTSTVVTITPLPDALAEAAETVILTISPNAAYVIGTPGSATVTIADSPP